MTEPTTKYIISSYRAEIKVYSCTKETAHYVWLESKSKDYKGQVRSFQQRKKGYVFDTWAEAHAALMRRADDALAGARRQLEQAQGFAGNVRGMKEPTHD